MNYETMTAFGISISALIALVFVLWLFTRSRSRDTKPAPPPAPPTKQAPTHQNTMQIANAGVSSAEAVEALRLFAKPTSDERQKHDRL